MVDTRTTSTTSADRFVDRARKSGVKDTAMRWYVRHAERYMSAFYGKRLAEHTREDATGYLEALGRIDRIEDWPFRQVVDAVQTLLSTANATVVRDVDWAYWRDSARSLATDPPTIAQERDARGDRGSDEEPVSGARFKEKRNPPSALDQVWESHRSLMERLAAEIRRRKYSISTEQSYESWVCRFILFCGGRAPSEVATDRIVAFLENLALRGQVSASRQNQALNAWVFLYKQVLGQALDKLGAFTRAKRPRRLPVVLTRGEVARLLEHLEGTQHTMVALLYGSGSLLMECVRLRVQDVDFQYHQIIVRDGKGQKGRVVALPNRLEQALTEHLEKVRTLHRQDLAQGYGEVFLPDALSRKWPNAPREEGWQYVFPSGRLSVGTRAAASRGGTICTRTGCRRRSRRPRSPLESRRR